MKRYIVIISSLVLFLSSCESFIDLEPLDQISSDEYWTSETELEYYTRQFYPSFCSQTQMVAQMAVNSDDMIFTSPSNILNGSRATSTGNWINEWTNIRNVNIFFDNYSKCRSEYSSYKQYLGEAYFFRAWFYYNLLKKYGDLPWYSNAIELDDDVALNKARDSRSVIADSIIADLDKAVIHLNTRRSVGNTRINKEVALAFLTRVALYEGSWEKYHANSSFKSSNANPEKYFRKCIIAAEELMNGNYEVGIYNTGNPETDYFNLFGFDNMNDINEVLLYKAFNSSDGLTNATQSQITYNNDGKGVTWDLVSSYLGKDGKPYDYRQVTSSLKGARFLTKIAEDCDPRLKASIYIPGDLFSVSTGATYSDPGINAGSLQLCPTGFRPKKSANPNSVGAGKSWETPSETGLILMRYGEVLLNYAEAKYEIDNIVAYDVLNVLRHRVGMPDFKVNPQTSDMNRVDYGYEISDELYEIRRERHIEMALEGLRYDDLMRWAADALFKNKRPKGYPVDLSEYPNFTSKVDENGLLDYFIEIMPSGYQFKSERDYLYSIPQDELILNSNLTQNPGW